MTDKKDAYLLYLDWYGAISSGDLDRGRIPRNMPELNEGSHAVAYALAAHHAKERSEPISREDFEDTMKDKLSDGSNE